MIHTRILHEAQSAMSEESQSAHENVTLTRCLIEDISQAQPTIWKHSVRFSRKLYPVACRDRAQSATCDVRRLAVCTCKCHLDTRPNPVHIASTAYDMEAQRAILQKTVLCRMRGRKWVGRPCNKNTLWALPGSTACDLLL